MATRKPLCKKPLLMDAFKPRQIERSERLSRWHNSCSVMRLSSILPPATAVFVQNREWLLASHFEDENQRLP
jgi:hypothetical protein